MKTIRLGRYSVTLPRNRAVRTGVGVGLVAGGFLGFLPILGFWMLPLGMLVLASDSPRIRRVNRRVVVAMVGWWKGRKQRSAAD